MTLRILFINIHSDANAGDAALTQTAVEQLEANFSGCEITLVMNDPVSYRGRGNVTGSFQNWIKESYPDRPARWRIAALAHLALSSLLVILSYRFFGKPFYRAAPRTYRDLFRAYVEADLVVSAAGGFLYSSGKVGLTLVYNLFTLALAWLLGKPFYLLPQSIGPFHSSRDCRLVRRVLERARIIMVRENISLQTLKEAGLQHSRLLLIPDLALALKSEPPEAAQAWLEQHATASILGRPRLGITAINWQLENSRFRSQSRYEQALAETARCFIEEYDGDVFFFTQVSGPTPGQDDRIPARRIAAQLAEHSERLHLLLDPVPPGLLQALYGEMDIFIATRLHSAIFALLQKIPVVAVGYQPKTQGITQMLGLERWSIPIEQVNGEKLSSMLRALWMQREEVRRQVERRLPGLAKQAGQAGALIAEDYRLLSEKRQSG